MVVTEGFIGPKLGDLSWYLSQVILAVSFPTGESCGISWGIGVGRWMGRVMPGQAHPPVGLPGTSLFTLPSYSVCWEQNWIRHGEGRQANR